MFARFNAAHRSSPEICLVCETGEGKRILPAAIIERFVMRADGDFEPLTGGSTRAVAQVVQHAGVVRVKRYAFDMGGAR
jgi:hypothetical protein